MNIQHTDNGKNGRFFIELDNKQVAEMTYLWDGDAKIIIDHTHVDEVLKGKGAGKQMLQKAVEFARNKHIKIIPLCSFAKSVFEKVKEYADVL